jgi:peptide subunit release factor RF-3
MDRYLQIFYLNACLLITNRPSSRPGANPWRIVNQIRSKLRIPAAAVQVPIGIEDEFKGVVDLVHWRSIYDEGQKGSVFPLCVCSLGCELNTS